MCGLYNQVERGISFLNWMGLSFWAGRRGAFATGWDLGPFEAVLAS